MEHQQRSSSVDRNEIDNEVRRLWQAMDSHTHNLLEEPSRPTVEIVEPMPVQSVPPVKITRSIAHPTSSIQAVLTPTPSAVLTPTASAVLTPTPSISRQSPPFPNLV